jgi:hypothetical protein
MYTCEQDPMTPPNGDSKPAPERPPGESRQQEQASDALTREALADARVRAALDRFMNDPKNVAVLTELAKR